MSKKNIVETTQKGQTTSKNTQPEKVVESLKKIDEIRKAKKSKVPIGKITISKEIEARKKAREESYRNFRINSLKRRCSRMGITGEKMEELVKKLIEQMNAPKQYHILIMLDRNDNAMMKEALAKAKINYNYCSDIHFSIDGDQNTLAKIREIAPTSAKIHPYAKKMESVIPKEECEKKKKPTNNTKEKKAAANPKRPKGKAVKSVRYMHRMQKGKRKIMKAKTLDYKKLKKVKPTTIVMTPDVVDEMKLRKTKTVKKAA